MGGRGRWLYALAAVVAVLALFAILAGGFLWPRPQFRSGPWHDAPDSLIAPRD